MTGVGDPARGPADLREHLDTQIDAILKSDASAQHDVIVRMEASEPTNATALQAIMDGAHRRALSTHARDMLPAPADKLPPAEERPTAPQRAALQRAEKSVSAHLASQVLQFLSTQALKEIGLGALEPLLASNAIKEGLAETLDAFSRKRRKDAAQAAEPVSIWASNSAVLTLPRDVIRNLPDAVPGILDIFPNRRLYVPPIVAAQDLPNAVLGNDTCAWGLHKTGALAAWGAYGAKGEGVLVGLLDTGVDPSHPDLEEKIDRWVEFDGKGQLVEGSRPHDSDEHGTHCAGTICGGSASGRFIGMAPDAKLAVALVMNGRHGTDAQILAGMQWAIEQQVDVISMSLGGLTLGPEVPNTYELMVYNALTAGIPVVTAIGNSGSQTSGAPGNDFLSLAIGATDEHDRIAGFSGGRTHVIRTSRILSQELLPLAYSKPELSAPGVAVYSSVPSRGGKPQWKATNGTSMAAPHVAGGIAQLLSVTDLRKRVGPSMLRAQLIQDLIISTVEELGEIGQDHRYGFGRLDVLRAIGAAYARGYGRRAVMEN